MLPLAALASCGLLLRWQVASQDAPRPGRRARARQSMGDVVRATPGQQARFRVSALYIEEVLECMRNLEGPPHRPSRRLGRTPAPYWWAGDSKHTDRKPPAFRRPACPSSAPVTAP